MSKIINGDSRTVLKDIEDCSIDTIFTSPPYYGKRDYGFDFQLGLEKTPTEYIDNLVDLFNECKRVLKNEGSLFINIGDTYVSSGGVNKKKSERTGSQFNIFGRQTPQRIKANWENWMCEKQLMLIPSRLAIKMQEEKWILRNDIIWAKGVRLNEDKKTLGNPLPCHAKDRLNDTYEHIFHFVKRKKYYYDFNKMAVTTVAGSQLKNGGDVFYQQLRPSKEYKHIASYPEELIKPFIECTTPKNGTVLDPFAGSGTTLKVAKELGFRYIGIEGNKDYCEIIQDRINN